MAKKDCYTKYKTENRALNNKIKKFERIVRKFPNDKEAVNTLERLKQGKFKHKQKPLNPGSNKTKPKRIRFDPIHTETAGEQLSRLLGIPLPKIITRRKKVKAAVVVRKKKNVEKS